MAEEDLFLIPAAVRPAAALRELRDCLPLCEQFGLTLTESDLTDLTEARERALNDSGRIEFGGGILPALIRAFCDSPYVGRETWAATLAELQETFYWYKSEAEDRFTDEELIEFMVSVFNGRAQGSTDYLAGTSLEELCRYARAGWDAQNAESAGDLF